MASSGMISGVGFAKENTIASLFIVLTIASLTRLGPDTPMNISAPFNTSDKLPWILFLFVTLAISATTGFKSGLPSYTAPFLLVRIISLGPKERSKRHMDKPAAPAPAMTIFKSFHYFLIIFKEFIIPAVDTIAVPC